MRKRELLPSLLLALVISSGCSSETPPKASSPANDTIPADPSLQYAQGWNTLVVEANFAKTTITGSAHFITTRNACGKDADGVMDLSLWNRFAIAVNQAIKAATLNETRCYPTERTIKMDGTAELQLDPQGKKVLLEVRGGEICSPVSDAPTVVDLIDLINQVVILADQADCPNGWGSG